MNISNAVATRLKELLKLKKMSQYKLAQNSGISFETIKSIMKGKAKGVNMKTLILISEGLGIKLIEFLNSDLFLYENLNID